MKHTPGPWTYYEWCGSVSANNIRIFDTPDMYDEDTEKWREMTDTEKADLRLIAAAPEMLEALKYADKLIKTARQYFPKSIKNSDRFQLENTCATIGKAINKAEGNQ